MLFLPFVAGILFAWILTTLYPAPWFAVVGLFAVAVWLQASRTFHLGA